jgi:hypothetical protein
MQEIHNFAKNSSQETQKMLFRGFGNADVSWGSMPPDPPMFTAWGSMLAGLRLVGTQSTHGDKGMLYFFVLEHA